MDAIVWDVGALVEPDVRAVDALARLQLHARRSGHVIWLRDPGPRLQELVRMMGLEEVLPLCPLSLELKGDTEEGE
jgi:STAS domain